MSPAPHTYLDQKYDDDDRARPDLGRRGRGPRRLRVGPGRGHRGRATSLGVEAALWSETTETCDDVDSMVFPRLAAVAEVGWSARHDWEDFRERLAAHGALLAALGVNFHRSKQIAWS